MIKEGLSDKDRGRYVKYYLKREEPLILIARLQNFTVVLRDFADRLEVMYSERLESISKWRWEYDGQSPTTTAPSNDAIYMQPNLHES